MKNTLFLLALGLAFLGCKERSENQETRSHSDTSINQHRESDKSDTTNKKGLNQSTKSEKALFSDKDKMSEGEYVTRAIEAIREIDYPIPKNIEPVISETVEGIQVTWSVVKDPDVRSGPGPDIQVAVIIDRDTGDIIAVLGG